MDGDPTNSSFPDPFMGPDDDVPKLVVVQPADDFYYPYSRSSVYSSLFISSLLFFVFFILLIAAIIQCKRSTRIPHEEFALIPAGPVPGYMTIVHTHPNGRTATTAFQLYPKRGSASRYFPDRYHSDDAPPSYQSMTQDSDLPSYQSVEGTSSDRPSTSASQPSAITLPSNSAPKKTTISSNPFLDRSNSDTNEATARDSEGEVTTPSNPFLKRKNERPGLLSESESFTEDDVFYEVNTCPSHEGRIDENKKLPEGEAKR